MSTFHHVLVLALAAVVLQVLLSLGDAAAPADLSNFQGNFGCAEGVRLARVAANADASPPSSTSASSTSVDSPRQHDQVRAVQRAVERASLVKATGLGHSWWKDNFCAGSDPDAVNVMVRREDRRTADGEGGGPPPLQAVVVGDEEEDDDGAASSARSSRLLALDGGVVLVNPTARTVKSPAGVTTRELLDLLASVAPAPGWTLPTIPWFIDQTIGGAVATGSHGSSLSHGGISYLTYML